MILYDLTPDSSALSVINDCTKRFATNCTIQSDV